MQLNSINPAKSALTKGRKRIGRGPGSGWGTTGGRGQKGAGARKSAKAGRVAFEGGQMPMHRRIPKRGFKTQFPRDTQIVNLKAIEKSGVVEFDAKVLFDQGLVRSVKQPIKVLGYGTISKAVTLKVNAIREKAKAAVDSAGGHVEIVS